MCEMGFLEQIKQKRAFGSVAMKEKKKTEKTWKKKNKHLSVRLQTVRIKHGSVRFVTGTEPNRTVLIFYFDKHGSVQFGSVTRS